MNQKKQPILGYFPAILAFILAAYALVSMISAPDAVQRSTAGDSDYIKLAQQPHHVMDIKKKAKTVNVMGNMTAKDENGKPYHPKSAKVVLFRQTGYQRYTTKTDKRGNFIFKNVKPGYCYVLVGLARKKYMGVGYKKIYVTPGPGYYYPDNTNTHKYPVQAIPTTIPVPKEKYALNSWHMMMDLAKPGTYRLDLSPNNLDPSYDGDTKGTYNVVRRSYFRFIRNVKPKKIR